MEDGRVECPKCKGEKYLAYRSNSQYKSKLMCHQCNAIGTVCWVDLIFNRMKLEADHWCIYERVGKQEYMMSQELVL